MPTKLKWGEDQQSLLRWSGRRIRAARQDAGLTQVELARRLGYKSAQTISDIERGISAMDTIQFSRLAKELDYPMEYFVDPHFDARWREMPRNQIEWRQLFRNDARLAAIVAGVVKNYYLYSDRDGDTDLDQGLQDPALGPGPNPEGSSGSAIIACYRRPLALSLN